MTTASPVRNCPHCGIYHQTTCPRIRAIEYHQDGTIKRVEFHAPQPVTAIQAFNPNIAPTNGRAALAGREE